MRDKDKKVVGEVSGAFQVGLFSLSALVAGVVTYTFMRLWHRWWLAAPSGLLLPTLLMLGYFLYLESLQPVGPFYAVIGMLYVLPVMLTAAVGTSSAMIIFHSRHSDG